MTDDIDKQVDDSYLLALALVRARLTGEDNEDIIRIITTAVMERDYEKVYGLISAQAGIITAILKMGMSPESILQWLEAQEFSIIAKAGNE